jgi:hypothetical protein
VIFGASRSAGGGVLQACLGAAADAEARAIVRRSLAVAHPKLRTIEHAPAAAAFAASAPAPKTSDPRWLAATAQGVRGRIAENAETGIRPTPPDVDKDSGRSSR